MRRFSSFIGGVGAALLLWAGAARGATISFAPKVDYPTGAAPYSAASGDFNRDGDLDVAVVNQGGNTVSVLPGKGNGTFGAKVDYPVGNSPLFVAVADFNRDGKADLAVSNDGSNTVSILMGRGDGTFAAKVDYPVGAGPYGVAVGDFNGDGNPDLAVADFSATSVSVLLNQGDGTFAAKSDYPTGTNPRSVATGDFNRDGVLDLAVTNNASNTLSVLFGQGNGAFTPKMDYPTGTKPYAVVVADFNRDGNPDLAVSNGTDYTVSILLGSANGTFAAKTDFLTSATPVSIAVADFNRDGDLDLAVANYGSKSVSLLAGRGDGSFAAKADNGTGNNPYFVLSGDLNGDGKPDLAAANYGSATLSVLLNTTIPDSSGTAPSALISQFRLGGPGGTRDEFIEIANVTGAALSVAGWKVTGGGVSVPLSGTIPANGHLLLINSGGYSLGAGATGDISYSGDIQPTATLALLNAAGVAVDEVSDLSTFAAPTSNTAQYAYIRRLETGAPSNTGTGTTDFNLVDTVAPTSTVGASGVGMLSAPRLGSPNPHNLAATTQRNAGISNSPLALSGVPGVARYASKNSAADTKGRLSIRRMIKNNTGVSVSKLRFRITAITAGTSNTAGVADLRAISSGGVKYFDSGHNLQQAAIGMPIDAPTTPAEAPLTASSAGNGGGLNAGWTVPLPGGALAAGATVNVEFLFGIKTEGRYRIVVDAELLP